jgi:MOSC domain-containing protein YiiM
MNQSGTVVSIFFAPTAAAPMISVPEIQAIAGKGLDGDRYFYKSGTYSKTPGSGREVTLIEVEALEALSRDYRIKVGGGDARRNIVTRDVALNHFVERDFTIGAVLLRGTRLCEPCRHLEKLSVKGTMRGLIHRGGLRAVIVSGGMIRVGDAVAAIQSLPG